MSKKERPAFKLHQINLHHTVSTAGLCDEMKITRTLLSIHAYHLKKNIAQTTSCLSQHFKHAVPAYLQHANMQAIITEDEVSKKLNIAAGSDAIALIKSPAKKSSDHLTTYKTNCK